MKKEEKDYSMLRNIIIIILFFGICSFVFIMGGQNQSNQKNTESKQSVKQNEKQQEKAPQVQQVVQKNPEQQNNISTFSKYKFTYSFTFDVQGYVKKLDIEIPIPADEQDKQQISNLQASIKPDKIYNDGINTIAKYHFENLNTGRFNITFNGIANVRTYNIKTAKALNLTAIKDNDLNKYLQPEPYIESNDPQIMAVAKQIKGSTQEEILQNIYEYVQKHVTYKIIPYNLGAKKTLQQKVGKCTEFSTLMTALCRAKKIPARIVMGNIARADNTKHNWVEVYLDKYGWVTYDPTTRATIVNIRRNGKIIGQEKRYDTSHDELKYIASGRNKYSTYTVSYASSPQRPGSVRVIDDVKIAKMQ